MAESAGTHLRNQSAEVYWKIYTGMPVAPVINIRYVYKASNYNYQVHQIFAIFTWQLL